MGVPGFFGWLVQRCRGALVSARDPHSKVGSKERQEASQGEPELSRTQMDCLYLDMNGIIHPCCHGEGVAPIPEEDMMVKICEKVDEIMQLIKPTSTLFLAIDGTAPRAKMNQQRTRRFRAAQVREMEATTIEEVKKDWIESGLKPPADEDITPWDSNVITPGTPFMEKVASHLQYYIAHKIATDPLWKEITVIFSDSNEPGEGEHKIIQYIKRQRSAPGYNPNTTHCIVGEDADLIMLAMSIHTPHMYILRGARAPRGRDRDKNAPKFNYLVVSVIMGYFEKVFAPVLQDETIDKPRRDLQRMIDDLTLVFCLVGNDFLPHIPGMKIQHNALAVSVLAYVDTFKEFGGDGYLTDHGEICLENLGVYLKKLSNNFRTVTDKDADRAAAEEMTKRPPPQPPGMNEIMSMNPLGRANAFVQTVKYHLDVHIERDIEEQKANDTVCVGTVGWEDRHYLENFEEFKPEGSKDNPQDQLDGLRKDVAREYLIGLAWVVRYYFQDCPSWSWYYPYHYSPVLGTVDVGVFVSGSIPMPPKSAPYTPYEQLSAVLPEATSKLVLPTTITKWLSSKKSPLKQYYPKDFHVDLRACPPPWHCTVILPFIDDSVFKPILKKLQKKITDEADMKRNGRSKARAYLGQENPGYNVVKKTEGGAFGYDEECTLAGKFLKGGVMGKVASPFTEKHKAEYPDLCKKTSIACAELQFDTEISNKSVVLEGTNLPNHDERLKPGPLCKKPSFSFASRIVKAGLPIVLQPGKALDTLQKYWQSEVLPCYHFRNYGRCKFGDECRYSHDVQTKPPAEVAKKRGPQEDADTTTPAKRPRTEKTEKIEKPTPATPTPTTTTTPVVTITDSTKLIVHGGVNLSRDDLAKYIKTHSGLTPVRIKWKVPGGKTSGTAIVRLATKKQGEKVFSALENATLPGYRKKLEVEKAVREVGEALPKKTKVKKVEEKPAAAAEKSAEKKTIKKKVSKKKKKTKKKKAETKE